MKFENEYIKTTDLQPGSEYKRMVKDSFVSKIAYLLIKIDEILVLHGEGNRGTTYDRIDMVSGYIR